MSQSNFPETRWTRIRKARHASDASEAVVACGAFTALCKDYWPPLFAYVRATGLVPEEAQRLVNELFYRMTYELFPVHNFGEARPEIETEERPIGLQRPAGNGDATPLLERAEQYRVQNQERHGAGAGRLRDFFMLQLKTILRTDWRSQQRASQNGDIFSVADATEFEHEASDEAKAKQRGQTPEEIYRRHWRKTLISRARKGVRDRMEAAGELDRFRILWPLVDRDDADSFTSAQAGEQLGMTADGVRGAVMRMKKELRENILRQIADTVDSEDPAVTEEEVRALFA